MTELEDYPVRHEQTVSWGQMDALQHVNNVEYFRFFEDARIAYFEKMGIYAAEDSEAFPQIGPILAATSCRFLAPVTYPDELTVGARTTELHEHGFSMEYAIASDDAERVVAVGEAKVVSFDFGTHQKVEMPQSWREAIRRLEPSVQSS